MNNVLNLITIDRLKDRNLEIAEVIGIEAFRKLLFYFGGAEFYVPKYEKILLPIRNELIKKEYRGNNANFLSHKYGLSERYIRSIVKDCAETKE